MKQADPFWLKIRADAEAVAAREPALAPLIKDVFLSRSSLEEALSVRLTRKLAYHSTPESHLVEVFSEALAKDPNIILQVQADILAIRERDPACRDLLTPIL